MPRRAVLWLLVCAPLAAVAAPIPPEDDRAKIQRIYGTWTDPDKDCTFKLNGGELKILIPATEHRMKGAGLRAPNNAPRTLREVDGDFTAVLRVAFPIPAQPGPKAPWLIFSGGLLAWESDAEYLMVRRGRVSVDSFREAICRQHSTAKEETLAIQGCDDPAGAAFLRLKREGNKVGVGWSRDGKEWTDFPQRDVAWGGKVKVGVVAENFLGVPVEVTFDQYSLVQPKK